MSNKDDENRKNQLTIALKYQGALAVEGHLTEIANKEGDEAVARITRNLSATEVAQVTSRADVVSPSLLHTAVTAEQFRGVFRRVGIKWGVAKRDDCSPEIIHEFQEEIKQFFCAFILSNDNTSRRIELIKVILDEPHGLDSLIFSVISEKDFSEFIESENNVNELGDWREVIAILRSSFLEQWKQFKDTVARVHGHQELFNYLRDVAAEIYAVAVTEGSVETSAAEGADELFEPLE
ncbi:MAG: hypothetical protein WC666_04335 [Candidatus Paceibacterota bacterium]|jgi:hypothetical protein